MDRTELRRRADGLDRIVRVGRWSWVWALAATALVVGPLALGAAFDLPSVVLAVPPMTVWIAIWMVFRNLDAPPPRRPPPRRRQRRTRRPAAVIPLRPGLGAARASHGSGSTATPR